MSAETQSVLITGGTGSFGKACVKKLIQSKKYNRIVVFSRDEQKHFDMRLDFPIDDYPELEFMIGDVRDLNRLNSACSGVEVVIHAAAMKHLELSELNPTECIQTNIKGTENLIQACIQNQVKKVMAVSTDKAVSAVSLYGATKLVSDKLIVAANRKPENINTLFSVVRYGNFLGSKGSVLPLFLRFKQEKGFIPITHPEMTRFNVGIEEGVEFVLNMIQNQSGGEIFVPKMKAFRVKDLAELIAGDRTPIKIVGIKQGEKLHEEAISLSESDSLYQSINYFVISPKNNKINTQGLTKLEKSTSYSSNDLPEFLSKQEIELMIENIRSS